MKDLKYFLMLSLASAGFLLSGPAAKADPYSISLILNDQPALAGDIVEFDATITNNIDQPYSLFLNGYNYASLDSPLTWDDTDTEAAFLSITYPLDPGDSYTGALFFVTVPLGTPNGTYIGDFQVQGGSDGITYDPLADEVFTITVNPAGASPVPEPSSLLLLLSGMAGLAGTLRRRLIR
jgi:hypothetical protein